MSEQHCQELIAKIEAARQELIQFQDQHDELLFCKFITEIEDQLLVHISKSDGPFTWNPTTNIRRRIWDWIVDYFKAASSVIKVTLSCDRNNVPVFIEFR